MRSEPQVAFGASLLLTASAFLPWLTLGDVRLAGVPDPAGYFVAGLGVLGAGLSVAAWRGKPDALRLVFLAGLAAVTTLVVVWLSGPATVADRALAHAEAVALVDNVALQAPPAVHVSYGLAQGLFGASAMLVIGLRAYLRPSA